MRTRLLRATSRSRTWYLGALLVAVAIASQGCLGDANESADAVLAPGASESWVEGWDSAAPPTVPTLDELDAALNLDEGQAAIVSSALTTWQTQMNQHREQMQERMQSGRPGRESGHGMPGAPGDFEPPLLAFLETVVPALDSSQSAQLAQFLSERRAQDRPNFGARGGRGRGGFAGPIGHALRDVASELDLLSEQTSAIRETMKVSAESFRTLRESFRDGTITAEELRDQAGALRESLEAALQEILSESQYATLQAALDELRSEMISRRLENLGQGIDRRVEFLTKVLALDGGQSAAVRSILEGSIDDRRVVLEALRDGTIEIEEALYRGYLIAQATSTAIRAELSMAQAEIFDALEVMWPGHRRH